MVVVVVMEEVGSVTECSVSVARKVRPVVVVMEYRPRKTSLGIPWMDEDVEVAVAVVVLVLVLVVFGSSDCLVVFH